MTTRIYRYLLLAAIALFLTGIPRLSASMNQDIALHAGEQGLIKLDSVVVAGDLTLRPGTYRVQHVADGQNHFVRFTRLGWERALSAKSPRRVTVIEAEVTCEMQMLPEMVGTTTFYVRKQGGTSQLTKIEIQGEQMAHLF